MIKNSFSIQKKWDKKIADMKLRANVKYSTLTRKKKEKCDQVFEYEAQKLERKKQAYIKKKEAEYKRKMNNEIRELEGKPKKELKTPAPKIKPLQFAMELAQENSKLRDTDENGNGRCISCDKMCSWGELAGGHRYSRKFQTVCLEKENINAQCHTCNFITGPMGNHEKKILVNMKYDENLNKKYGEGTSDKLSKKVSDYFQGKGKKYDLEKKIPSLIKENKKLWATKNFYKPKRNWDSTWTKYLNRS